MRREKLIGIAAHPLNRPHFDEKLKRVTEGYGILQPRVSISLTSAARSRFAQIFSGNTGIDPYTTASSDVYQDLFGEGSFTGKGLYDVDAFEKSLAGRVPENSILSHDLFEGLYARCGLVSNIELLDDFPTFYDSFAQRGHRWVRGDWQIARWIFPYVKNADGNTVKNHLPLISRWKIFDNLRRSLVAPTMFLWLLMVWTLIPGSPIMWTLFVLIELAFPIYTHLTSNFIDASERRSVDESFLEFVGRCPHQHSAGFYWRAHLSRIRHIRKLTRLCGRCTANLFRGKTCSNGRPPHSPNAKIRTIRHHSCARCSRRWSWQSSVSR